MTMTLEQLVKSAEVLDWYNNLTLSSLSDNCKEQESTRTCPTALYKKYIAAMAHKATSYVVSQED
jgi:hypothetical protein